MLSIDLLLLVAALVITILAGIGRAPLWPALLLVIVAELLHTTGIYPH
jgi:membrane protein YqaA with SNARE-associated domain